MKIMTALFLKFLKNGSDKPRQAICFFLFVFLKLLSICLSANHSNSCSVRYPNSMLSPAISRSCAAQKIGAAYRLHPYLNMPQYPSARPYIAF